MCGGTFGWRALGRAERHAEEDSGEEMDTDGRRLCVGRQVHGGTRVGMTYTRGSTRHNPQQITHLG